MQQEVVLAMLAKEPSQGYQLRARMNDALGPLGEALNAGQVYVTLGRLEKTGLVAVGCTDGDGQRLRIPEQDVAAPNRGDGQKHRQQGAQHDLAAVGLHNL